MTTTVADFASLGLGKPIVAGVTRGAGARGLVLVPARELAMQVAEAIHKYARGGGLSVVPLCGRASMEMQIRAL